MPGNLFRSRTLKTCGCGTRRRSTSAIRRCVSNPTAKWVTVDDAINLDPKSLVTGERRYTFDLSGQLDFVTNSQANSGRHDFVNNSTRPPGPHVFHNSVANNALNDSGPHQRWATGTLVRQHHGQRRQHQRPQSRQSSAHARLVRREHGDLEFDGGGYIVQNPPTAQNWLIGSTGTIINDTKFGPQPPGYVDSHGTPVTAGGTNSLYDAQMNDSADIREFHWGGGNGNWTDALQWREGVTPGVYRVSTRDYLVGDIDGFTYDGAEQRRCGVHRSGLADDDSRHVRHCRSPASMIWPATRTWPSRFSISSMPASASFTDIWRWG